MGYTQSLPSTSSGEEARQRFGLLPRAAVWGRASLWRGRITFDAPGATSVSPGNGLRFGALVRGSGGRGSSSRRITVISGPALAKFHPLRKQPDTSPLQPPH